MADLSPAAASIVQAFDDRYEISTFNEDWQEECLAAALRALAVRINGADAIRQDIIDIATELEAS
jgi:hypothetical protein